MTGACISPDQTRISGGTVKALPAPANGSRMALSSGAGSIT
jgi:hypothetical protein